MATAWYLWKVDLESDELRYLMETKQSLTNKDTKQGVWSAAGFLSVSRVEHKRMDPEWKLS